MKDIRSLPAAQRARAMLKFLSLEREGAGNAGCTLHPRSRVQSAHRKTHTSIQVQSEHSGIPCAMALRLMPCSPRRRIRLVTVAAGLMADRSGWNRFRHRQLGTSNGCRDHTVLPYATTPLVLRAVLAHGKPPCEHTSRARRCRVHHIPSRVRDDRETPLVRDETAGF